MTILCPTCQANGTKSTVRSLGVGSTLIGFSSYWDEDGHFHRHDPNTHNETYRCSLGHEWSSRYVPPCPHDACTYGKDPA